MCRAKAGADDTINALRPIWVREKDLLTQCVMNGGGWRTGGRVGHQNNIECILSKCTQMRLVNGNVLFCFHYCCGYIFFIIYCWPGMSGRLRRYGLLRGTTGRMSSHTDIHTLETYVRYWPIFETVNFLTCNNFIFKRKSAIKLKNVQQRPFIRHAAHVNTDNTQSRHIQLTSPSIRFVFSVLGASLREHAPFQFLHSTVYVNEFEDGRGTVRISS